MPFLAGTLQSTAAFSSAGQGVLEQTCFKEVLLSLPDSKVRCSPLLPAPPPQFIMPTSFYDLSIRLFQLGAMGCGGAGSLAWWEQYQYQFLLSGCCPLFSSSPRSLPAQAGSFTGKEESVHGCSPHPSWRSLMQAQGSPRAASELLLPCCKEQLWYSADPS